MRLTVILALAAALVVIVLALLALYVFTIRPTGQAVAGLVSRLAALSRSVEASLGLVGETNAVQLELARILEGQRQAFEVYRKEG